jgi:hypothetical protein
MTGDPAESSRVRRGLGSAGALALAPWVLAAAVSDHDLRSALRSPGVLAIVATDALVFESIFMLVGAPLAGVALVSAPGRRPGRTLGFLAALVLIFTGTSAVIVLTASRMGALDGSIVLPSRATLAAVALALAALGALLGALLHDVLDAAGAALLVALAAAGLVFAAGPAAGTLSKRAIDAALLANPVIAASSAARIDLLRGATLYRISPLAHRRFDYPGPLRASTVYLLVAGACMGGTVLALRARQRGALKMEEC